jgi:hypothetical protein
MKHSLITTQELMSKAIFVVALLCGALHLQAQSSEQKAIMQAIEGESRAFYQKDHTAWSEYYVQGPEVFWACVEEAVTLRASGWADLSQFVSAWMKDNPEPVDYDAAEFRHTDIHMTIHGSLAFVSMRSSNIQPDGKLRTLNNSRTMQNVDGRWKILSMVSYPNDVPQGSTPNVYVHQ